MDINPNIVHKQPIHIFPKQIPMLNTNVSPAPVGILVPDNNPNFNVQLKKKEKKKETKHK